VFWSAIAVLGMGRVAAETPSPATSTVKQQTEVRRELTIAAYRWRDATLARDIKAQSVFYPESMDAFYLWRDVPKSAVLKEKRRVFQQARTVDIDIEPPQILVAEDGRSARMYFRKVYVIEGPVNRRGEVLQELRWVKQADGWKIVSERDLQVIRHAEAR
jgi:hypothetical protein